jgi:hypothetical protein
MTFTALAHHKKLLREGFDPKSDEYYEEINSYMKSQFPNKFQNQQVQKQKKKHHKQWLELLEQVNQVVLRKKLLLLVKLQLQKN